MFLESFVLNQLAISIVGLHCQALVQEVNLPFTCFRALTQTLQIEPGTHPINAVTTSDADSLGQSAFLSGSYNFVVSLCCSTPFGWSGRNSESKSLSL